MVIGYQHYRRDPSCRISKVLDFFGLERAVEDSVFAVGEPFLENLIAAELVAPNSTWDVTPEGLVIEIHVERFLSEYRYRFA